MKKTVLAFGTFDYLHEGHRFYLRYAKALGDILVVLVACDEAVRWAKKRAPYEPAPKRLAQVQKLPFVNKAFIGNPVKHISDYLQSITEIRPDIICLGYDQLKNEDEWFKNAVAHILPDTRIKRAPPLQPDRYKSSYIHAALTEGEPPQVQ